MMNTFYSKVGHKTLKANGKYHSQALQTSSTSITNCWDQPGNHLECQGICSSFAGFDCSYKYLMKILLDYSAEWNKLMAQVAQGAHLIFTKWSGIIIYFAYYISLLRGFVLLNFLELFKRCHYCYKYEFLMYFYG